MRAVQIQGYSKEIHTRLASLPVPRPADDEVLVRVRFAAVNPLELLIMSGGVKLIQDYPMPLTLGNEFSGIVEKAGKNVKNFHMGDAVYGRMPVEKIGAFAEYVAVPEKALAHTPKGMDLKTAAAIPLTALTAYQGMTEILKTQKGETLFIAGGSGSFGQMAVPIGKALGLRVLVSGNSRARDEILALGAETYIDYTKEDYRQAVSGVNYVIDTLGEKAFLGELSVLKIGGKLLSLRGIPNRAFALRNRFPLWKRLLFSAAGRKYDRMAQKEGKEYDFMFVRADGEQLRRITKLVEDHQISPRIDGRGFTLEQAQEALEYMASQKLDGKVILEV